MSHRCLLGGTESRSWGEKLCVCFDWWAPKQSGSELELSAVPAGGTEAPLSPAGRPLSAPQHLLEEALPIFVSSSWLVNCREPLRAKLLEFDQDGSYSWPEKNVGIAVERSRVWVFRDRWGGAEPPPFEVRAGSAQVSVTSPGVTSQKLPYRSITEVSLIFPSVHPAKSVKC